MFGREDAAGFRDVLQPLDLEGGADDGFHQPMVGPRPVLGDFEGDLARQNEIDRCQHDHADNQVEIKQRIEKKRAQLEHQQPSRGAAVPKR